MRRTAGREDPEGQETKPLKFSIGSDDEDQGPLDPSRSRGPRHYPGDSHTPPTLTHMKIIRWLARMFPRIVVFMFVAALVVAMLPGGWRVGLCAANILPPPPLRLGENVTLVAHRGCEFPYPENTVKALQFGAKLLSFVELDLAITKDGEVVAMHDNTLERTTNGTGVTCERTAEYIKSLEVKTPERDARGRIRRAKACMNLNSRGQGIPCTYRVPTLGEVFDSLPAGTRYMLDLKECYTPGVKAGTPPCTNCTMLLEGIKKAMSRNFIKPDQITYTSSEPPALQVAQKMMPVGSEYALGMNQKYSHYKKKTFLDLMGGSKYGSASFYIGLAAMRPDLVSAMRNMPVQGTMRHGDVFAWTVRNSIDYSLARCAGVSKIIVAEPETVLRRLSWDIGTLLGHDV